MNQFRERHGDNAAEEYGREGTRSELQQAAVTVHAYLIARIEMELPTACSLMSEELKQSLRHLFASTKQAKGLSCPAMLRKINEPTVARTTHEGTEVDAGSLRVEGNDGFLFFNANTNSQNLLMRREDGIWKVNGLLPSPLH